MATDPSGPFSGRSVLVTGAAGGIGGDFVRAFAAAGADVVASDLERSGEAGRRLADEADRTGPGRVAFAAADITSDADLAALVARAVEMYGGVDVLVNNAGVYLELGGKRPLTEVTNEMWDRVLTINARGTWQAIKAVVPEMRRRGSGRIVNISSGTAHNGVAGFVHYVASKAAVEGITRAAARELGPDDITVNAVAPGLVETDATVRMNSADYLDAIAAHRFIRRGMKPRDLVSAVLWLASPDSGFVTGQTVVVDGGQLLA